jgi:NCS1 family nucleobase:cation symporter-1
MGMLHNVVAYETAAGLMALGMNVWQALGATAIAYMFLFFAMWFNAVSGTRYGLPFCVLTRSSFGLFWILHGWIVTHGVHRIRNFELVAGPLVILVGAIATIWGFKIGHGLGPLFAEPSHLSGMKGFLVFAGGVTGLIGVWSTFAVNIPDLSRFVGCARAKARGAFIGRPKTPGGFNQDRGVVGAGPGGGVGQPQRG